MIRTLGLNLALLFLTGCSENKKSYEENENLKGRSQGGYSDIIVVAEENLWDKGLKDDVSFVFSENLKGLYQKENNFDITHVRPSAFSTLFKKQRLLLEFEVSQSVENIGIGYKEDKYASGQLYVKVSAKSFDEASSLLLQSAAPLRKKVSAQRIKGLQLMIYQLSKGLNKKLWEDDKIMIPDGYSPVTEEEYFKYFGKKNQAQCESGHNSRCNYQLGLMLSKMQYTSKTIFTKDQFVLLRDSLTNRYIAGPKKEIPTFMEVEKSMPLSAKVIELDGNYCVEYRGWWNMVNATMGGPFISYLVVDRKGNNLFLLDGFVFAPNFKKRGFLKELEAIIRTFKIGLK